MYVKKIRYGDPAKAAKIMRSRGSLAGCTQLSTSLLIIPISIHTAVALCRRRTILLFVATKHVMHSDQRPASHLRRAGRSLCIAVISRPSSDQHRR